MSCRVIYEGNLTETFQVNTGVRHGCLLSRFLFLLGVDWIMRKSTKGKRNGIQWILWNQLDDLNYADDIALLSPNHNQMQDKIAHQEETAMKLGLSVSKDKTKTLRLNNSSEIPLLLEKGKTEEVSSFTNLRSNEGEQRNKMLKTSNVLFLCLVALIARCLTLNFNAKLATVEPILTGQEVEYSIQCNHTDNSVFQATDLVVEVFPPYFMTVLSQSAKQGSLTPTISEDAKSVTFTLPTFASGQFIDLVVKGTMALRSGVTSGTQLLSTTHIKLSYKSDSACSDEHESTIDIPIAWYIPRCKNFDSLGLRDGRITDSRLTSSSSSNKNASGINSLGWRKEGTSYFWTLSEENKANRNNYIQLQLKNTNQIEMIHTEDPTAPGLREYILYHSMDGVKWTPYTENSKITVFDAYKRYRSKGFKTKVITPAITARFIRIYPQSWFINPHLRLELYGCSIEEPGNDVAKGLGMESRAIEDGQLTASSSLDSSHSTTSGRLNVGAGWCASVNDQLQYLQIDLLSPFVVTKLDVQGKNCDCEARVLSFHLAKSDDGNSWEDYKENTVTKDFLGNTARRTTVTHNLLSPLSAQFLQFKPKEFQDQICLRVEVYGLPANQLPKPERPVSFLRSFLLESTSNMLIVCNAEIRRANYRGDWKTNCYRVEGPSQPWIGMYWKIKSLLGYDKITKTLYAVSSIGNTVVKSLDSGYRKWEAIQLLEWTNIMHQADTMWATEIPFIPETDDVEMTLEPRTPLTKTAANNDKWGASGLGVHFKASGDVGWRTIATWSVKDVNPCSSSPCLNNGRCDSINSTTYQCVCSGFFEGTNCQDKNGCEKIDCGVLGVCINTFGSLACSCDQGYAWDGSTCKAAAIVMSSSCGGRVYPNGMAGVVWTPGFPGNYNNSAKCYWSVSSRANVTVTLSQFKLESRYDYFYVYDGGSATSPLIGRHSGSVVPPPATSSTNQLYLRFTSDSSVRYSGFNAHFKALETGSIRLIGHTTTAGRVEVYYDGKWGSVCANSWGVNEANVVCRQHGFPGAIDALGGSYYGNGTGQIWLDNVNCSGTESQLNFCNHDSWGSYSCNHDNDASVKCQPAVRLRAGGPNFGRVEVYHDGNWGAICDDISDLNVAATLVCKELGFLGAATGSKLSKYGADPSVGIMLDDVQCTGKEFSIIDCVHRGWKTHNCNENKHFGVFCQT